MAGAGDGEEFGEALQKAENDRFEHSKVNVAFRREIFELFDCAKRHYSSLVSSL